MSEELEATPTGLGRRQFIKSSAAVGGLVWAAPAMSTFGARAFAGSPDRDMCPCGGGSGQPSDLVWEYRPDLLAGDVPTACTIGDQPRGGQVDCTFAPPVDERFDLVEVHFIGTPPQTDSFKMVEPGDSISIPGKAGATQEFVVKDSEGNEIHRVGVHTSCSYDLAIGDRFGAFVLLSGTAGDQCP